jgi:hypothetical protein
MAAHGRRCESWLGVVLGAVSAEVVLNIQNSLSKPAPLIGIDRLSTPEHGVEVLPGSADLDSLVAWRGLARFVEGVPREARPADQGAEDTISLAREDVERAATAASATVDALIRLEEFFNTADRGPPRELERTAR